MPYTNNKVYYKYKINIKMCINYLQISLVIVFLSIITHYIHESKNRLLIIIIRMSELNFYYGVV